MKINFKNVDKEKLLSFLNTEFHNFTEENDKQLLNEIINEYKNKNMYIFRKEELKFPCKFSDVQYEENMDWK